MATIEKIRAIYVLRIVHYLLETFLVWMLLVAGCFVVPHLGVNGAIGLMAIAYTLLALYAWRLFRGG